MFSSTIAEAFKAGWNALAQLHDSHLAQLKTSEQASFSDAFFIECLRLLAQSRSSGQVCLLASHWHSHRKLNMGGLDPNSEEGKRLVELLGLFRQEFDRFLQGCGPNLPAVDDVTGGALIRFWRDIFLSSYSPLNQYATFAGRNQADFSAISAANQMKDCGLLLRLSMQYPFDADRLGIDVGDLFSSSAPSYAKVLVGMWLVNVPRYNATQFHRQKVLHYFPAIVRFSRQLPAWMDPYFHPLAEWLMVVLFRLAYIHEDNSGLTMLFGDFVAAQMRRLLPGCQHKPALTANASQPPARIKIGYLSHRLTANAVTFYMANRILRHDRGTFEVFVFMLGTGEDDMTRLLAANCDHFIRLENAVDYSHIASAVIEQNLDILLFTDIGMEIHSYLLAGMRLAPVQAALLGHASPTGLPTVDYFFSSEVDFSGTERHYREKLIRLPGPGADQIMPPGWKPSKTPTLDRTRLGIPEDAFVFVSCANGMKHVPERDWLWTEILRRIPTAWILLKPFGPGDSDFSLRARIAQAGVKAGASDRIRCVEGCESHQDVFSLLSLADAQLDTYPFNGWTTTIEAFCLDLPTVTQEGWGYRSRIGACFLRSMGIEAGIAGDEAQYIDWAIRLAASPELCCWIRQRIRSTRDHLLFTNHAVQMAFENQLIKMALGIERSSKT